MGFLDRVLDTFKIGDDEYDYDDDSFFDKADDMEDDYEEPKASGRGFFKRRESNVESIEEVEAPKPSRKVAPLRSTKRTTSDRSTGMSLCVQKPLTMEDARLITDALLSHKTVVLNLEGLDIEVAQRIIDYSSGTCYAIEGHLQKISTYIFILTPSNVDISGDFQDILSGAFDIPSVRPGYYNE